MEALRPLTADPSRAAIFLDVDGTLAPIVERAADAKVPQETSQVLGRLARRYALVACISGRAAADVRRLVGVGALAYSGLHGAELLEPNERRAQLVEEFARHAADVRRFALERDSPELRTLRVRIEDKGPIMTFHWRGAPDEASAHARVREIAEEAEAAGLWTHWGRKVLEIRPPVPMGKDRAVRDLLARRPVRAALYAGDDATDLDGFEALSEVEAAVRVGVRSDEGPAEIVDRADLVVDGVDGMREVLAELDRA